MEDQEPFPLTDDQAHVGELAQALADEARNLGQEAMRLEGAPFDPPVLSALLLLRALDMFEGLLLVANAGLGGVARTLARPVVEAAICIAHLHAHPSDFVAALEGDHDAARLGQAKALLNQRPSSGMASVHRRELDAFASELRAAKPKFLDVGALAGDGAVSSLYLLYRVLSDDAAHVSLTSLGRYLDREAGSDQAEIAPDRDRVDDIYATLDQAMRAFMAVCVAHTQIVGDAEGNGRLADLERRMRALPAFRL